MDCSTLVIYILFTLFNSLTSSLIPRPFLTSSHSFYLSVRNVITSVAWTGITNLRTFLLYIYLYFFIIPYNSSFAHIAAWDLSSQRNASVKSLLMAHHLANFCTTNRSPVLSRESWQINENSWKKHNFSWTPCII